MYYDYKLHNVQRFLIEAFRFLEGHDTVYLHCELLACHQDSSASRWEGLYPSPISSRSYVYSCFDSCRCAQGCSRNNRKKRSSDIERGTDGTRTYRVRAGPVKLEQRGDAGGKAWHSPLHLSSPIPSPFPRPLPTHDISTRPHPYKASCLKRHSTAGILLGITCSTPLNLRNRGCSLWERTNPSLPPHWAKISSVLGPTIIRCPEHTGKTGARIPVLPSRDN